MTQTEIAKVLIGIDHAYSNLNKVIVTEDNIQDCKNDLIAVMEYIQRKAHIGPGNPIVEELLEQGVNLNED